LTDEHIAPIAKAMQVADFGGEIEKIIEAAPQYVNSARAFIAALNAAFTIFNQLQHPQAPPPNRPAA
jgi:hypothetical protein